MVGRGDSEPPPAEGHAARANRELRERNPAALLRESLLGWLESHERLYLFVDEIQNVRRLPNDACDDFLALLRAAHLARSTPSERGRDALWSRLCVCVAGIATPLGLGHEPERTSYNIGRTVSLEDFPIERAAQAFVPVLRRQGFNDAEKIFEYVYGWTLGHPFHTQRFCQELSERERPAERDAEGWVRELADALAQTEGAYADSSLSFAERRLLEPSLPVRERLEALESYRRLLESKATLSEAPEAEGARRGEGGKVIDLLTLSGLVAPSRGRAAPLRPRSRFFAHYFDHAWVDAEIAKLKRPLTEIIERWRKNECDDEFLPRSRELDKLNAEISFDDLTAEEREFWLRAQNRESKSRLRAIGLAAAAALVLAMLGGGFYTNRQAMLAGEEKRAAMQAQREFEARRNVDQGRVSVDAMDKRRQSALSLLGEVSAKLKDGTLAPEAAQIKLAEVQKVLDQDFVEALNSWRNALDLSASLQVSATGEHDKLNALLLIEKNGRQRVVDERDDLRKKNQSQIGTSESNVRAWSELVLKEENRFATAEKGYGEKLAHAEALREECEAGLRREREKVDACERTRTEDINVTQELTAARDLSAQELRVCKTRLLVYEPPSSSSSPPPQPVPPLEGVR